VDVCPLGRGILPTEIFAQIESIRRQHRRAPLVTGEDRMVYHLVKAAVVSIRHFHRVKKAHPIAVRVVPRLIKGVIKVIAAR
jgi:hypothetical protein